MAKGEIGNEDRLFQVDNRDFAFDPPAALGLGKALGKCAFEQRVVHGAVLIMRNQPRALIKWEKAARAIGGDNLGFHLPACAEQQGRKKHGELEAVLLREPKHADWPVEEDFVTAIEIALDRVHQLVELDELKQLLVAARDVAEH